MKRISANRWDYLSKSRWVSKLALTVVLSLWMLFLHFFARAPLMASLQNELGGAVDTARPLNLLEKILLFPELIYFWFVAWFVCKRTVFCGGLDNYREHRRYWSILLILLVLLSFGFRESFWSMWLITFLLLTLALYFVSFFTKPYSFIVDGTVIRSFDEVIRYFQRLIPPGDPGVFWGGMRLPSKEAMTNFLIVGSVGSGKTISLSLLMQSVLNLIGLGQGIRAIVYDYKGEMASRIAAIAPSATVHILNPLHQHCTAWDMAADITTDMNAEMFAMILFPDPPGGQQREPFFIDAARKCLKGVVLFLNDTAPQTWQLRDIIYIMLSQQRLMMVLGYSERTRHNLDYFSGDRMAGSVMATIKSKIEVYIPIAALWHRAQQKISLKEWAQGESILILGHDPENAVSLRAINSLIFDRAMQILLKKENADQPQSYVFLDELGTLHRLGMLDETARTGRSKGIVLAAGFQSITDLYNLYGRDMANVIVSQFMNKAFLRLSDEATAQWAEHLIGQKELLRMTRNRQFNGLMGFMTGWDISARHGESENYVIKSAVLASEFREILPINAVRNQGLTGWYVGHYVYKHYFPFDQLMAQLIPPTPDVQDRLDAPDHWQRFEPWDLDDLARLNLIQHQELLSEKALPPASPQQLPEDDQPPVDWQNEADNIYEQFAEFLDEEDEDDTDSAAA